MTEEDFIGWKDQTRQSAMEKEVQRLRELSQKQSGKLGSLRRIIYFISFFFIVLFTILLVKGMLIIPEESTNVTTIVQQDTIAKSILAKIDSSNIKETDLYIPDTIPVPLKETKGIVFCVQIGAYTGIDLEQYKENLVSLQQDSYEGINQLTLGRFTDYNKAIEFLSTIQQIGFHDAFIMSFKNGRRVQVQDTQNRDNQSTYSAPIKTPSVDSTVIGTSADNNI